MTAIGELLGKPVEAPATMPTSVHEHEPRHEASMPASEIGHLLTANPTQAEGT
jgi:hypothetical protein